MEEINKKGENMGEVRIKALERKDILKATDYIYKAIKDSPTYKEHRLNKLSMERTIASCIYDSNKCCFLMLDKKKIVGMLGGYISTSWFSDDKMPYDLGIYIDKEYRGAGVSKPLFMKWFEFADKMKVDEIVFSCTADARYYKKMFEFFTKNLEFNLMGILLKKRS